MKAPRPGMVGVIGWIDLDNGRPIRTRIDLAVHWLSDRRLAPRWLQAWACALRGRHGSRYWIG